MKLIMRALLGRGPISRIIAWRSGGWSHIDFLTPDGSGWWSAFSAVRCGVEPGCRLRPLGYYGKPKKESRIELNLTKVQWNRFWLAIGSTDGLPYDKTGLFNSFVLGSARDWRTLDSFWCSEWFIWALEQSGFINPLNGSITSVDPGQALAIASAFGVPHEGTIQGVDNSH